MLRIRPDRICPLDFAAASNAFKSSTGKRSGMIRPFASPLVSWGGPSFLAFFCGARFLNSGTVAALASSKAGSYSSPAAAFRLCAENCLHRARADENMRMQRKLAGGEKVEIKTWKPTTRELYPSIANATQRIPIRALRGFPFCFR